MGTLMRPLTAVATGLGLLLGLPAMAGTWSDDDVAAAERFRELERERAERYRAALPEHDVAAEPQVGPGHRRADEDTRTAEKPRETPLRNWLAWLREEIERATRGPEPSPEREQERRPPPRREPPGPGDDDVLAEWLAHLDRALAILLPQAEGEGGAQREARWRDTSERLRLAWSDARAYLEELRAREAEERALHFYRQLD